MFAAVQFHQAFFPSFVQVRDWLENARTKPLGADLGPLAVKGEYMVGGAHPGDAGLALVWPKEQVLKGLHPGYKMLAESGRYEKRELTQGVIAYTEKGVDSGSDDDTAD